MQIWASSQQYLPIPVYGPEGVNLSQYPVAIALAAETAGEPALDTYQTAAWVDGTNVAAVLITQFEYPPGKYMAWAQVTATPEIPVIQCGRVQIGDGVSPAGQPGAPAATWVISVNGQTGQVLLPVGAALTFATSIVVNATGVNDLAVTLTGNATLQNPTGLTAWQILRFHVTQGAGAPWTLAYGSLFNFGTASPPTLSTAAGDVDIVAFQYDPNLAQLCYMGSMGGF